MMDTLILITKGLALLSVVLTLIGVRPLFLHLLEEVREEERRKLHRS